MAGEAHAPAAGAIEAEGDDYFDRDSALESEIASSTTSVGSSILNYRRENGRTYHAYKEGAYLLPNDEPEQDRLDLVHHLFALTFEGKLFHCPLDETKLHRVLDLGTGTGIWAIDFADDHPQSQVLGVDLSPIQPFFVPPNLLFEVDDVEEPWTYEQKFDFIHGRSLTGSIANWPKLITQIYDNLNPGGWAQLVDHVSRSQSDDGTLKSDSFISQWDRYIQEGCTKMGRACDSAEHYKELMLATGFEEVVEVEYKWPINRWPKNPKLKEIGMWELQNMQDGLSGLSIGVFTRLLDWDATEAEAFFTKVKEEFKDTRIHAYNPVHVVYGRKPLSK